MLRHVHLTDLIFSLRFRFCGHGSDLEKPGFREDPEPMPTLAHLLLARSDGGDHRYTGPDLFGSPQKAKTNWFSTGRPQAIV